MGNCSHTMNAVEMMLDRYGDMILRIAFTYMKNLHDAEDVLQEVLMIYMTKGKTFESETHEKAWFIRVTMNYCKNKCKSSWNRLRSEYKETDKIVSIPERSEVLEAVIGLPKKYKEVIYLYYYEGYSVKEIATLLEKKESAVKSRLSRGRAKLKVKLKEEYEYEELY